MGVIHMNGRIYDPMLGRFMQGDPAIQDPEALAELLDGSKTRLTDLIIDGDPADISATALQIQRRAQGNQEERGLQTLFIAYGMASWPAPDSAKVVTKPSLTPPP